MYPIILPINLTPAFSNSATNRVFSDKNPYPDYYIQCKLFSIPIYPPPHGGLGSILI